MGSFPIVENNANNVLHGIKRFCYYVGFPKIIQTDNGSEYNNNFFAEFCGKHKIIHINSRLRHPQIDGVVEVLHKEIRQYVLMKYSEYNNVFDLKDVILEVITYITIKYIVLLA